MKNPPCRTHYRTFHPWGKCNSQTTHKGSDGWNCMGGGGICGHAIMCQSEQVLSINIATPPWGPFSTVSVAMVFTVARTCFVFLSPNVFLGTRAVSDSVNALQSPLPQPGLRWGEQSCRRLTVGLRRTGSTERSLTKRDSERDDKEVTSAVQKVQFLFSKPLLAMKCL